MKQKDKKLFSLIGNIIAYYRKHKGMTQRDVADILDVDESYISKIETASNGISIPALLKSRRQSVYRRISLLISMT